MNMDISERCAVELRWDEVCSIISEEIREILGLHVQCKANVVEHYFWSVTFVDYRLPLPMLCQLVQATQPALADWEEALLDEGDIDVNGIGMGLAEKLLARHLKFTWEHHLIISDSLWLVGTAKEPLR